MEQTETLERPASEAEEQPPAPSEESASQPEQADDDDISPESRARMNDLIRGLVAQPAADSTSKPDGDAQVDTDADDAGGASASRDREGVKPSEQAGKAPGRRGAAAEIDRLNGEVERLTRALDDLTPKAPDASEEARTAAIERENRYRRLLHKPESDTDWTHEDIQFLEGEKQKRALVPELTQHYETVVEAEVRQLREQADAQRDGFWQHVRADMATARDVPGVDFEAVKKATTFAERDRLMYSAGAASHEPELKRLRDEVADLKRELYGTARAPLNGGRSSPGREYSETDFMNTLIRGGRRSA